MSLYIYKIKISIIIIFIKYLFKLYKNNLFYKLSKYKFNIKEIKFLGFLINIKGI